MKAILCFLLIGSVLASFTACSAKPNETSIAAGQAMSTPRVGTRIKVVDVSNDTRELFDVDVIGMLWSGLDLSLNRHGLLWTEDSPMEPLRLEAHIIKYSKGNVIARNLAPYWGKTRLVVRCDLKSGDREVASVESKETISIGNKGLTIGAYKKIFNDVSEKIVNQLAGRL
jgi:hypothetical protein